MTDVSLPVAVAFTIGSGLIGAGAAWGVMKATLANVAKEAANGTEALKQLADFKLTAAKDYVSTAALLRLEGRLDEGFKAIRDEMRDQNALIINALSARSTRARSRDEA
jgi:hypothetical protein